MTRNTDAIIAVLEQNSVIDAIDIPKIKTHIEQHSDVHESTTLLRLFFWMGAFLTGILLYLYLLSDDPLKNINALTKLAASLVVFIPCSIFLERMAHGKQGMGIIALLQLSIALTLVGKYYFCTFFHQMGNNTLLWTSMGPILITALTYPFFCQEIDRFLSPLFSLIFLFIAIITDIKTPVLRDILLILLMTIELVALITLFFHKKTTYLFIPLAYAIAIALLVQSLFSHVAGISYFGYVHNLKTVNALIAGIALLAVIYLINREKKVLTLEQSLLIAIAVASLICLNVFEILLSIFVLTLGYARREAPFLWLGLTFLPLFIVMYYYEVEMTLLSKSLSLMGTGLILLAGKFYMDHRVINQSRHS